MGDDFHITRRMDWAEEGDEITADEWLSYVRHDPELYLRQEQGPHFAEWTGPSELDECWLDWCDGQVYTKNPDPALIDKMLAMAQQIDVTVQGDDGETYEGTGEPTQSERPGPTTSFGKRAAAWFARFTAHRRLQIEHEPLPFAMSDRVRDTWGIEYRVIEIKPKAENGTGVIRTRRDDGTEHRHMLIGHGLMSATKRDRSP